MLKEDRKAIRKAKIACRNSLPEEERKLKSKKIVDRILNSIEYKKAKNILIYNAMKGEVSLEDLKAAVENSMDEKVLYYPLVTSSTEMIALHPKVFDGFKEGAYGIKEPIVEKSIKLSPQDFDLVICPCTAFDEKLGRMGMGAGYYDRFLESCKNATIIAVAFECQKVDDVMAQEWDKSMDMVFTEDKMYAL